MKRVLMVCLGNICRSPLAEGILKSKVDKNKIYVDSAGTAGWHSGNLPDERSIEVARLHQIDISSQKSRKFKIVDFDNFDYIFVMDQSNYQDVLALARNNNDEQKVHLILESSESMLKDVPDPYYGGDDDFEYVYQMLNEACENIKNKL